MSSSFKTIVIVNPAAAHGTLGKVWKKLADDLNDVMKFEVGFTKGPGDATYLAKEALRNGYEMVVAVGGDGTLCECLNGFYKKDGTPHNPKGVLGILPYGRGSDFARGLGLPREPSHAMQHLKGRETKTVDIGKITFKDKNGKDGSRYFINIANVGIVGNVDNWSHRAPKFLGAKGAYVYGTLKGALEYRPQKVRYAADGRVRYKKIMNIIIANGRYFGAGMDAAPRAKVDDGQFDVVVAERMGVVTFMARFPKLYTGKHLRIPEVDFFRADRLDVELADKDQAALYVEADGDTLGHLPAKFEVIPKALRFKV